MGPERDQHHDSKHRIPADPMDISAAFLKGMTYEKIAEMTGEPLRSVQFDFPRHDAWLLQQLPGMSDYNHHTEVLDLVKALWGLKDAPGLLV